MPVLNDQNQKFGLNKIPNIYVIKVSVKTNIFVTKFGLLVVY